MKKKQRHIPLGQLISEHRKELGYTRAELARLTGISDNSLIKYEKAGMDGGQWPPANKLAKLCFYLSLPTAEAIFSCLEPEDLKQTQEKIDAGDLTADAYEMDVMTHPLFKLTSEENYHLANENAQLRSFLRFLVLEENSGWFDYARVRAWLKQRLTRQFAAYDEMEKELIAQGVVSPIEMISFSPIFTSNAGLSREDKYVPSVKDLHEAMSGNPVAGSAEKLSALKGPAGDQRKEILQKAIEFIDEIQNEESPGQSPNSPGLPKDE